MKGCLSVSAVLRRLSEMHYQVSVCWEEDSDKFYFRLINIYNIKTPFHIIGLQLSW